MERILCHSCACGTDEQTLLLQLRAEQDPRKRAKLALHDWNNHVVDCNARLIPALYPMEAWQRFAKEHGIAVQRIPQPVD